MNHFLWLQETHDPWKWAQDTAEKISEENGFLIFIGGPPTEMGLAIYKDKSSAEVEHLTQ